jgi:transcriptional regulator with XRE-family HTH domain
VRKTTRGPAQAAEFGRRVRAARDRRGISQETLGELSGLHRTYVGHVERGEVNPSLYNVLRIAHALEVDPSELVRGLRPEPGQTGP